MAVSLSLLAGAGWQFLDDSANPLTGGLLYTYIVGTTTPLTTYTSSSGATPNSNPIVLDAAGRVPEAVWLTVGSNYKFVLKNSGGVTIWTKDNILGGSSADTVTFLQAGVGAVTRTAQAKMRELKTTPDYSIAGSRSVGCGLNVFPSTNYLGVENTALGSNNLTSLISGAANVAIGVDVLSANTTGNYNTAVGVKTLYWNIGGINNSAFGTYTLYANLSGIANSAFGQDASRYNSTGSRNSTLGVQALYNNDTGSDNTAVGIYAARGVNNPPDTGPALGPSPTFITAVGANALYTAAGTLNVGVGSSAGYLTTGSYNTYLGSNAGYRVTSGAYNVHIGYNAGQNASQSATGSYQTVVGRDSYATGDNAIVIGSAVVAGANQCAIGNASQTGVFLYGGLQPQTDNTQPIGGVASRWSVVYAGTGTINTSDERTKQQIKPIDAAALRAWAKVEYVQYKFNDAVQAKGDGARWHFGLIAQRVKAAFESEGLDAFAYGVLCYDEWEAEPEVLDADGKVFKPAIAAGTRYGIRYEEALALECAYLRSRLS